MNDLESQVHRIISAALSAYNAKAISRRAIERKATQRILRLIKEGGKDASTKQTN
jgi:hypothetical protein